MNEELKVIISAEISKLKQGIDDAKNKIKGFKEQVADQAKNVDANFKKIGESVKSGLKTAATVGATALVGVATALIGTSAATEEYRINQAKLQAAFEQAGLSAKSASGTYKDLYAAIGDGDQAAESAANIALLADSEKQAAEWAQLASGVLGTFHDTLQPEAFYEAANETLKLGEATGAFTQMLEQTGVMSVDTFNKKLAACTTEEEKQALMLEVSKKAMSDAGAAYDKSTANIQKQREEQVRLQDTLAKIGEAVTPVITAFMSFANDALAKVQPYISELAEKYGPQLQEALDAVAVSVEKAMGFIANNWEILAAIGGVIGVIVTAIGLYNVVAAVKAAMDAAQVTTLGALIAAYLAQAAAMAVAIAPYALIVAAIAAVIAIIVVCVKHWDKIKEAVQKAWNNIKEKTKAAVDAVVKWFENMKAKTAEKIENIKNSCKEKFENIKSTISNKVQAAKDAVVNKFNEIVGSSKLLSAAKDVVVTVFEGIKSNIQNKIETAKNIIKNVVALIKSIFTGDLGGAKTAVLNIFDSIKTGIKNKLEIAINTVKGIISRLKSLFNFKWSLPKLKMPHFKATGKFSLNPPSVPKISVSWYAKGGVFDKPTLFSYGGSIGGLGENGAEAVVPLEKNTKWLDRLATMLNDKQGNRPIYLIVDKKVLGKTSAEGINDITRQTGSIPLIIK